MGADEWSLRIERCVPERALRSMTDFVNSPKLLTPPFTARGRSALMFAALLVSLAGCSDADAPDDPLSTPGRGDPEEVVSLGELDVEGARAAFEDVGLEGLDVEHDVEFVRARYHTLDASGAATMASMLLARPVGCNPIAVVNYQHGTAFHREEVPSEASLEDTDDRTVPAAAFAGHCYLFVAPDYLGLGSSPGRHPFLHARSEASAVVDSWRAARSIARERGWSWPEPVFLFGFSQGAHAALSTLGALPGELRARAMAGVSGPYNLSTEQLPFTLGGQTPVDAAYLGYVVSAYANLYPAPAAHQFLESPYDVTLDSLFDGSKHIQEIIPEVPPSAQELLTPTFARQLMAREPNWFLSAMTENDVDGVVPAIPVRLYYSSSDSIVSPSQSPAAAQRMQAAGSDAQAIDLGEIDHLSTRFAALPAVRAWFDAMLD